MPRHNFNEGGYNLKSEISLKSSFSQKSLQLSDMIKNSNSVSISIRRGDFVTDRRINNRHGVLDYSYYKNALRIINNRVSSPYFYIFSDDIAWVKENWRFPQNVTYADFNFPDKIEEDLILGSLCKHNIIANSTFSWWSAWLNNNKNKIVIAPNKWFNQLNYDTGDLIPDSWIRI